jgi:hypothetical protein
MKRKFSLFLLLSLFSISNAQAKCNLEIYRFGSSYQEIQHQIGNTMQMGKREGQLLMEHSLTQLISEGEISPSEADDLE